MSCFKMPTLALVMLASVGGCGGEYATSEIVDTAPVSGTLTYKGQPLEYYQVVFMPVDGTRVAAGVTDAEGKFKMGTNDGGDGAPPGEAKVAVSFVGPPSTGEAGLEQVIDDPSKLPKPKIKIPAKYGDPETSGLTQTVPPEGITDLKLDLK
jgi:hypothetical protein